MRGLMVLRCGASSIHRSWIERARTLWDVAFVSYDGADFSSDTPTYAATIPGTKLTGIRDFFTIHPELLDKYDYFWLLEDDLFVPYETISGALDFVDIIRPALCAPSLSHQSFFTHPVMIQNDALFARGTDFVECMAPIMSREFFKRSLEQFSTYPIYGIERFWQHLLWEMQEVAYVLDALPIVHTRPVGSGTLYGLETELGIDRFRDDLAAAEKFGRPFNRYVNTLFGVKNTGLPTLIAGLDLVDRLWAGASRFLQMDVANKESFQKVIDHTGFVNSLFSKCLTFSSVQRLFCLPQLSGQESDLIVRDWSFGSNLSGEYAHRLRLKPNGRISGYVNDNEYEWKVEGEDLFFFSRAGQATTRFTQTVVEHGKIRIEGPYLHSQGIVHYLKEI